MRKPSVTTLGFTLIELLVTVAIAAIVLGIAVPSFTQTIASNRLTATANQFMGVLNYARSEAIKRGQQVTVLNKGTSARWESGWDVFVDADGSNAFNDNGNSTLCEAGEDCLLKTYSALPSGYTFRTSSGTTYKDYAAYLPTGLSKSTNFGDTFTLCSSSANQYRTITINLTGRPQVATVNAACP